MSYWPDQRPPQWQPQQTQEYPEHRPDRGGRGRPDPDDRDRVSERHARLTLTLLAGSFAVLVVGVVVFFTVRTLREVDRKAAPSPVVTEEAKGLTPEEAAKISGGIGPPAGADVVSYGQKRKDALAAATGDRIAVVSFWNYTTEAKARALAGDAQVLAILAAAPGGKPDVVTTTMTAWVSGQTADARSERDELNKLIPTVDDPKFKADYQSRAAELTKLINAISPTGNLVFGLVLRAPSTSLQALATNAAVRIVDVGPSAEPDAKPIYRGLRPEENSKANDPSTRPTT